MVFLNKKLLFFENELGIGDYNLKFYNLSTHITASIVILCSSRSFSSKVSKHFKVVVCSGRKKYYLFMMPDYTYVIGKLSDKKLNSNHETSPN